MVDSTEIEELRALVFASIPAVARKATKVSAFLGHRRCTSLDTEDGEILSDEDAAAAMVAASTVITRVHSQCSSLSHKPMNHKDSEMQLEHPSIAFDSSTEQTEMVPGFIEVPSAIITEPPNLVAVVPSHNQAKISEMICGKAAEVSTSKDEIVMTRPVIKTDAKIETCKVSQRFPQPNNGSRAFKGAAGTLASRLPSASLASGGFRKEADAFLASLNIPAVASSSHLPNFTEDRHNSLVIKFSDDDSDSDGEQDGQGSKDRFSSKRLIAGDARTATSLANSRFGMASQTTSGLISKIDRVKKQIAAIERTKGSSSMSRPSKTTGVEATQQLTLKPGIPSTTGSLRMLPLDLENLRQQIAAKETELQRRKQKGSKEVSENQIVFTSTFPVDILEGTDAPLLPVGKPESEAGVAELCIADICTSSELSGNETFNNINEMSEKGKFFVADGPNLEQENCLIDGVLLSMTPSGTVPMTSATEVVMSGLDSQFAKNNAEHVLDETAQPVPGQGAKLVDIAGKKASFTPKRKRQESDSGGEILKKTRKKGTASSKESSLLPNASKGGSNHHLVQLVEGNSAASIKATGGIQSSQSKEPSMPVQGIPMAAATMPYSTEDVHTVVRQTTSENLSAGVVDANLQLDSLPHEADHIKYLSTHENMTCSAGVLPLRTMPGQLDKFGLLSREQKKHQRTSIGVSSCVSSLPVWDCCNANGQFLGGFSDHKVEYTDDSLWKLLEEEDAADEELEKAQRHRRRCEIREHLARKQYLKAQEALHGANLQCEILFQRREMLSARFKAAQLQLYSSRSSLKQYHGKGALISVGVPQYAGKDQFSPETSLWSNDTGTNATLNFDLMGDQDCEGTRSDFRNVLNLPRTSPRFQPIQSFIAESEQCTVNDADGKVNNEQGMVNDEDGRENDVGTQEPLVLNSSASDSVEGWNVLLPGKNASLSLDPILSSQKYSTVPSVELCSLGESSASLPCLSRMGSRKSQAPDEDGPPTIALEVAVNGSNEKTSYGFSSASFATDLCRDGNQALIISEKGFLNEEQRTFNCNNEAVGSDQGLHSNINFDDSPVVSLEVHPTTVGGTNGMLKASEQDHGPEWGFHMDRTSDLLQEQQHQCDESGAAKRTDGSEDQIPAFLIQDSVPLGSWTFEADNLPKCSVPKDLQLERDEVQERCEVTVYNKKVVTTSDDKMGSPSKDQKLTSFLDCKKGLQSLARNCGMELDSVPLISKHVKLSDEGHCLEQTSLISLTSSRLNLLFHHAPDFHPLDIWKQLTTPDKADETVYSTPESFESPLHGYRCGHALQSMDPSRTMCRVDRLDPHRVLCMFEHRGKCNDDECIWQHKRDYMPSSSQKHSNQVLEVSKCSEVSEKGELKSTHLNYTPGARVEKGMLCPGSLQASWQRNWQLIKVPTYSEGSHIAKIQRSKSPLLGMVSKQQLRAGMHFLGLHREALMDSPYLFDSSLKLPTLNDGSRVSSQLHMEAKLWTRDDGIDFDALGDAESLLERALELFDYDINIEKPDLRKSVLYVISRGLEANPGFVALWVVYLHLFSRWEDSNKDDLFLSAVQHNDGSYELWMMFINSRGHLKERLDAYELAIISLGSRVDLQGHASDSKSSLLLDLALQRLNCLCIADLNQEAASWIREFSSIASEVGQAPERTEASGSLTLVACLTRPDLCILWICCAYMILQHRLPNSVVESLGCKQKLFFEIKWPGTTNISSRASQVMSIMHIAASCGNGCMKLELNETEDKSLQIVKEVFAINFVQCAAVCEGLHASLSLAEKYFRMFPTSIELTLLRARLEQHSIGKVESLAIFEGALSRWPLHRTGKMGLWNQYIECAYEAKGADFVKVLLNRCAAEISDSDIFQSVCGNRSNLHNVMNDSKCSQKQGLMISLDVSNTALQNACQVLPCIVKKQLAKDYSGFSSQLYSLKDVVFAHVNLAFLEMLNEDYKAARIALQNGLNVAVDADSIEYCLKEIAVFTSKGLENSSSFASRVHCKKMLGLVDRCIVESQLMRAVFPLSKGFCDTIKRRRVNEFVASLVCPSPTDYTFLNSVLDSIHGSTLLPNEKYSWTDRMELAEKLLEISPSNVRLAMSICRIVQNKLSKIGSKAGSATLYWCSTLLIDSLCQASPEAAELRWVEAGDFLKLLEIDSLLEEFYRLALSVHPYSSLLWHGLLDVSRKTGNAECVLNSAKERGVILESGLFS